MNRRPGLMLLGIALIAAAVWLWLSPDFSLPARQSSKLIRFAGAAHFLAGLMPALAGAALLALGRENGEGRLPQTLIVAAFAAGVLAFVLAPRI